MSTSIDSTTVNDDRAHETKPLLTVRHLTQVFQGRDHSRVQAVSDVSFDVLPGETLGLVGESGCGKSSTVRAILQAPRPTSGSVRFGGVELTTAPAKVLRSMRSRMQLVFQDPYASLDPRWSIRRCLREPLDIRGTEARSERDARVEELLAMVGLNERYADHKPGQLSGGQCQRIAIARALALEPDLLLFDEAVSALDVSIQAQILNLIGDLRRRLTLTSVFIGHDLAVVKNVSDRIGVMYLGKLCEIGPADEIFRTPFHPYTAALLAAVPQPGRAGATVKARKRLDGDLPSPASPPSGCRFRTRCDRADAQCATVEPTLEPVGGGQFVACHHPLRAKSSLSSLPQGRQIREA